MKYRFTISNLEDYSIVWIIEYDPSKEIPFTTLFGTHEVWGWDMNESTLLKDGQYLTGYTIILERG